MHLKNLLYLLIVPCKYPIQADQDEMLPYWANDIFPHGMMYNVTLLEYDLLSATPLQRQLNGGTFLMELIGNSLKYTLGEMQKDRRMMLYSGDGRNIAGVLKTLDLWSPHIPNEAAALIFELYFDNDTDTHGIKVKSSPVIVKRKKEYSCYFA